MDKRPSASIGYLKWVNVMSRIKNKKRDDFKIDTKKACAWSHMHKLSWLRAKKEELWTSQFQTNKQSFNNVE